MSESGLDAVISRVSNWGRWGPEDELGTVNYITEEKRRRATSLVRRGRAFSLALPLDKNGPQPPTERRLNPQHIMLQTGADLRAGVQPGAVDGWGYADDMVIMALQCATQWDALSHAFYNYKMYNDRDCTLVDSEGAKKNGIERLGPAIATRGVLLDVARALDLEWLPMQHKITVSELEVTLNRQRVQIEAGDVLLIRTGNITRARRNGGWDQFTHCDEPGLSIETLPWLHDHQIAGVAADNWAFEAIPSGESIMLPIHAVGIVHMGLLIGEMFNLDDLANDCRQDSQFDFLFVAPPLPFTGAVGSPVNPIALK